MRPGLTAAALAVAGSLAVAPTACAQRGRSATAADSASAERVGRLLEALAHDSLEGRDTGSRGSAAAARIIAAEFARAGIEPAGDSGFFQRVPLAWRTTQLQGGRTMRRLVALADIAARDTIPQSDRVAAEAVNVVGVLRGSDPALRDEVVVVTAHYDHVGTTAGGRCAAMGADSICNPATRSARARGAREATPPGRPPPTMSGAATAGPPAPCRS